MTRIRSVVFAAVVLALVGGMSYATTYYVSIGGSDSNPGTSALPWATLQKAANTMAPGDTTIVTNGTYAGFRATDSKTGTSSQPKTIKAQNVRGVTLNALSASARHNGVIELEGAWDTSNVMMSYWVIDGFVVDGGSARRAIDTRATSHVTIQNCTTHHAKASPTAVSTGLFAAFCDAILIQNNISYSNTEHGCYTNNSADNGTVRNNTWYSNTSLGHHMNGDLSMGGSGTIVGDGQMTGWLIEKNTSYSNGSNGYDADGVSSSTWKNNLAYNNVSKALQMTQVDGASNPTSDRIINNTFCNPTGSFYTLNFAQGTAGGGSNNVIENNILYNANTSRGSIDYVSAWVSTLTSDYNVVVNNLAMDDVATTYTLASWRSTFGKDTHSVLVTDPATLFVSYSGNNFHLKTGSPAVNAGVTLADVTTDKDNVARPQGGVYDIGCYELVQTTPLSITTSSLPNGTVGTAYSQTLAATGGTTPYTWSMASGSLPAGLSLSSGGVISGTPTTAQTANFTPRVTDNVGATATRALSITISAGGQQNVTFRDGLNGYTGTRDTWLTADYPTTNYGTGVTAHLQYNTQDRQLHSFNVSSIPSSATVNSATIYFYVYNVTGGTPKVACYRVLKQWDELQATYNARLTGTNWGTPGLQSGVDYNATALGTSANITAAGWVSYSITSTVQGWVNGSLPNYGVMYKETTAGHCYTRMSEYTTDTTVRPKLVVTYTP